MIYFNDELQNPCEKTKIEFHTYKSLVWEGDTWIVKQFKPIDKPKKPHNGLGFMIPMGGKQIKEYFDYCI
jgi:hypothetical protein